MVVEIVAGIVASSLALLSDAAHMATDALAIGLALVAVRLAARPPSGRYTFGLGRAEILSAQLNGAALLVLAGVLGLEAIQRLSDPHEVEGAIVIVVGVLGGVANVGAAFALSRSERRSLNVEGAMAHVMTDLYASIAATLSGVVILTTGFDRGRWHRLPDRRRADAPLAPGRCCATPRGSCSRRRRRASTCSRSARTLAAQPGVTEVHDLHVWEVTSGFPALAAHVLVAVGDDCHARRRELELLLHERFGIEHTTLQVDHHHEDRLIDITPLPDT